MKTICECGAGDQIATPRARRREHEQQVDQLLRCAERDRLAGDPLLSLPNAMIEPQKETEPTIAAKDEKTAMYSRRPLSERAVVRGTRPRRSGATAPPPTPLNSATICGIAVILHHAARRGSPTAVPITTPSDDQAPVALALG